MQWNHLISEQRVNMKSFFMKIIAIASIVILLPIAGCKTASNNPPPNKPLAAFNDETYIWENWSFSTNQVEIIEQ